MVRLGLVIGAAEGNFEEARAAIVLQRPDLIYCVKAAGVHWPSVFDFWITLHPEHIAEHVAERRALGHPHGYRIVAPLPGELGRHAHYPVDRRVSHLAPGMNSSGSSGIYGALVALHDCERVILAGVPMDGRAHFARRKPWTEYRVFLMGWEQAVPHLRERVRSMSGLTAEVLGAPSMTWLAG